MLKNIAFIISFLGIYNLTFAQSTLSGIVKDTDGFPISDAEVKINQKKQITNEEGIFKFPSILNGNYEIEIHHIDYNPFYKNITIDENLNIIFVLNSKIELNEVVITHGHELNVQNKEKVNQAYIQNQFAGSFAKSLEKLPGIQVMEIGAGASKPIIRGLGFNRISVTENGIKQEGQQWGTDHGLEVDAFAVEQVEIIKGAGVIEYGGDAIGGIIQVRNDLIPRKNTLKGEIIALGKTVNQTLAGSLNIQYRKNKFFYKLKGTYSDYGDYSIPTENIIYLSRKIPIYNERLKNSAGRERDIMGQVGFVSDDFESTLTISNFYLKSGFFPGAHGVPTLDRVEDDADRRNIEYPYQNVNHFKVISNNKLKLGRNSLSFLMSYQNNHRQEWSLFHTHYGNQLPPDENADLELDFRLSTYSAQMKYEHIFSSNHKLNIGIQSQNQKNLIKGYNFLLPKYTRDNLGVFALYERQISDRWNVNGGLRFDYFKQKIEAHYDDYLYNYLIEKGYNKSRADDYAQRSKEIDENYTNINGALGVLFQPNHNLDFNLNLATNFRVPTAIELGANGIHHGSFRHELGDENLEPEKGYSVDFKATYHPKGWNISFNPYLYYFDNYIYLRPSGTFSVLPHGGQIYQFSQTKALISGYEVNVKKTFWNRLRMQFTWEYIYNKQINDNSSLEYPLPFTPPNNGFIELEYLFYKDKGLLQNTSVYGNVKHALNQSRIAQNEEVTQGYTLLGAGFRTTLAISDFRADVRFTVTNLLDEKYFNHTSFYRALEIPEMGRNIQLMVIIPF